MKKTITIIICLLTLAVSAAAQLADRLPPVTCTEKDNRIAVLLLGTYHMSNPGLDQFNLESDDVLAEKRQKEIQELSVQLAAFKPTKIAVESPFGNKSVEEKYTAYLDSKHELSKSEREQIGFRLGKMLKHEKIYPIDSRMSLDNDALGPVIGSDPKFQQRMGDLDKFGKAAIAQMGKWLSEGSVSHMLFQMNRPEILKQAHHPYVGYLAPLVKDDNYAGADMVATWYNRNLRIFANLNRVSGPGDRILVIYGQGHIPILKDLVEDSPWFCTVDPLPYLKGK